MSQINWNSNGAEKASPENHPVILPDQPEFIFKLVEGITRMQSIEGRSSPVSPSLIDEIVSKTKSAKEKHEEGMRYLKIASEMLMERDAILGTRAEIKKGDASVKFYLQCVKDILTESKGEQILTKWGFVLKK